LIGPNLVRREETDPQELFRETNLLNSLVEYLIVNCSSLFQRVCAPKEPSVSIPVLSDSSPAIAVRDDDEELDYNENGDDGEDQSVRTPPKAGPKVERERTEGMEEWEGSDEDAEADDFAVQGDGEGGAKKNKKKSKGGSKIKKKAENKTRPHRLSLSVKDDPSASANKKAKKAKKNKEKEKDSSIDSLSAIRGKSKTASADSRRLVVRERLSSSDIQAPTRRSSHLSPLGSLPDSSSGDAMTTEESVTVSWKLSDDGSQSTSTDDKLPVDALLEQQIRPPPTDSEDGDEQDTETTPEPEPALAIAMAGAITRFGQEVDRDLVRLRKGSLEQMAEVATEKEVMRIIKLLREREVEEVKQFSRVKHMKEIKEREIRDMAERYSPLPLLLCLTPLQLLTHTTQSGA
jgi:hypothetical protein